MKFGEINAVGFVVMVCIIVMMSEAKSKPERVCQTMNIRNGVSSLYKLTNCTIIEGSLSIVLIDFAKPSEYEGISFPDLVEITDYFLLYRVYGLKTLRELFPNLKVIRGQKLFYNYALVSFEMPDLEDVGLIGLTHILRGVVRFERNKNLCYLDTVNWTSIIRDYYNNDKHFFIQNKKLDECVNICPKKNDIEQCPVDTVTEGRHVRSVPRCWTPDDCQKICPSFCGAESNHACYTKEDGKQGCCDKECLGCTGPTNRDCTICANFYYYNTESDEKGGRCTRFCPYNTYLFKNRRCILEEECRNLDQGSDQPRHNWKLHKNEKTRQYECMKDCPAGYMPDENDAHICKKCADKCPKECSTILIDSIDALQRAKGCTKINGPLIIRIRGEKNAHIGRELEAGLEDLEEVTHYIKIHSSYPLVSLQFLKNLRIIGGDILISDRYALVLYENPNLQDIWDMDTHPKLVIRNSAAKVSFHHNRKLCLEKIEKLVKQVGLNMSDLDDKDVSRKTNGDKAVCAVEKLKVWMLSKESSYVLIAFSNYRIADARELLGYLIYYKEAPEQNLSIFTARDACSDDWKTQDVAPVAATQNMSSVAAWILKLSPWTQYGLYVQTLAVSYFKQSAQSDIMYFTTLPEIPSSPRKVVVKTVYPGELEISWDPPLYPNGNITHYLIYWQPQIIHREKFDRRNYCKNKIQIVPDADKEETKRQNHTESDGMCCDCPQTEEQKTLEENERLYQIHFENFIHNTIYKKNPNYMFSGTQSRPKRSLSLSNNSSNSTQEVPDEFLKILANRSNEYKVELPYLTATVMGQTNFILANLAHFTEYSIEVIACHDYDPDRVRKLCSNRAVASGRTKADPTADNVESENVTVKNDTKGNGVYLFWSDPPSPNGIIVTFNVEYKKLGIDRIQEHTLCIQYKEYREHYGCKINKLSPGNYSFRIRAVSLAGEGNWTRYMYFSIPDRDKARVNIEMIVGITVSLAILLLVIVAVTVWVLAKRRFRNNDTLDILYASVNPDYLSHDDVYIPDEWEVDRDKIELLRDLGQGSFGMVYEGNAKNILEGYPSLKVAVKTVNEGASIRDRIEFLNEASVMKAFNCTHVVKLLGVVSKGQPTLVVMELMAFGDLKTYLRRHRPDEEDSFEHRPPTLKQILQMAGEIADGMAYLAAKKFVHRDLAARNCMVSDNTVVKIGDFGMTRDIYASDYYRKGGKGLLPVRWMAPESLNDGIFTSQSDIWSYGVVLWEMATLAAQPYQGLSNEQVLKFVISGGIMEKPEGCPDQLYDLMLDCWKHTPKQRPTFCEIIEMLVPELNPSFKEKSFFFSEDNTPHEPLEPEIAKDTDNPTVVNDPNVGDAESSIGDIDYLDELDPGDRNTSDGFDSDSHYSSHSAGPHVDHKCKHHNNMPCTCVEVASPKEKTKADLMQSRHSPTSSPNNHSQKDRQNCSPSPSRGNVRSNEGSKESSKSSGSHHSQLNGMANGHIPKKYLTQFAEC